MTTRGAFRLGAFVTTLGLTVVCFVVVVPFVVEADGVVVDCFVVGFLFFSIFYLFQERIKITTQLPRRTL